MKLALFILTGSLLLAACGHEDKNASRTGFKSFMNPPGKSVQTNGPRKQVRGKL